MGIAVIIPNVNYQDANLGKVTLQQGVPLRSMTIVGPDEITEPTLFTVNFFPANTSQRGLVWSIVSGGTYASINAETGELTPIVGASVNPVVIRATSSEDSDIYAEKTVSVSFGMVYAEKYALVSDGLARIDTGYMIKKNSKLSIDYTINSLPTPSTTSQYFTIWGAAQGNSNPISRHLLNVHSGASIVKQYLMFGCANDGLNSGAINTSISLPSVGVRYKETCSRDSIGVSPADVAYVNHNYGTFFAPIVSVRIFAGSNSSASSLEMSLFSFKAEEGGSTVMNLVPCTLVQDIPGSAAWDGNAHLAGENGLWDKVGNKFYGNTYSSGSFSVID